jgi:molecular chaperone DnaK (HSP70)
VDSLEFEVFQGESPQPDANTMIGKFTLENLESTDRQEVLVKFVLDKSGLLKASAEDLGSKKKIEKIIHRHKKEILHKNLADLSMVRLKPEEESFELIECEETTEFIGLSTELEIKVQNLLNRGKIDESDREELQCTYSKAQEGEHGAAERLEKLVYYLD